MLLNHSSNILITGEFISLVIAIFLSINLPAQNRMVSGNVFSKNDSIPIGYVTISIANSIRGTYSNQKGQYEISCLPTDSIIFSAVGYKSKKCLCKRQNTYLEEQSTLLNELVIRSTNLPEKTTSLRLGYFNDKRVGSYVGVLAAVTYIGNNAHVRGEVSKVNLLISKVKFIYGNPKPKFYKLLTRLILFDINPLTGGPGSAIQKLDITQEVAENQTKVVFDTSALGLEFPSTGIFVGIEFLGYFRENLFIPFSSDDKNKTIQYKPSFAITQDKPNSWIRTGYNNNWILFNTNSTNCNFNFGLEVTHHKE